MEQWSILSNVVNYVQHNQHPKDFYNLDIRAADQNRHKKVYNKEEERQILVRFWWFSREIERIFSNVWGI